MLCEVRLSYLTFMRILRLSTVLVLSRLMDVQGPTQAQAPPSSQSQATAVHPDPKRAQKAAGRGDKAAAAGRFEEALSAYEEAARYAPRDAAIIERGAALPSKPARAYLAAAERHAVAGRLTEATVQ